MPVKRTLELPGWLKTNLIMLGVANLALIVFYATTSFRTSPIDIRYTTAYDVSIASANNETNTPMVNMHNTAKSDQTGCRFTFPKKRPNEASWYPVDETKTAFVFSVYFEKDSRKLVIVGAKEKNRLSYRCQVWYKENGNESFAMSEVVAKIIIIPEGHGKRYSAVLFQCSVRSNAIPAYVSIVKGMCAPPLHFLRVHWISESSTKERRFTVCLTPLNSNYNNVHGLVEWIELNRILGAEKFVVYNYSSAINIWRLLHYYSERGLAEVVQWQLPMKEDNDTPEIHYFGQVAALNDCLYRNKMYSEFIVNLDLDEFIIPYGYKVPTWSDMVSRIYRLKKKTPTVYLFRNTFFRKEWTNENVSTFNQTLIQTYRLITLQLFEREKYVFPPTVRSKYFARTSDVTSVMIHSVWGLSYNKILDVPPSIGLVHHYRNCEDLSPLSGERVIERTVMKKYGSALVNNVRTTWSEMLEMDTNL